jgi:3-hydroxyisobutyrate dehydrogenase
MIGQRVGFIGLGNMGAPMSARLLATDFDVTGFDVSPTARERFAQAGGHCVATLSELPYHTDVLILMLPSSAIVESVLLEDGLLAALDHSTVIIDMSSSEPTRTCALAQTVAAAGPTLIDAPVSGGVKGAAAGTLAIMAGGSKEVIDSVAGILAVLGRVTRVGGTGAGHAVKALNNLMSATHLWATSEAMLTGIRFGIDPTVMLSAVNAGSGRSGSTENKWPNFIVTESYDSGFALRLMLKDIKIATALARSLGVDHRLSDQVVALWAEAADELPPAVDHTEIARWLHGRISTAAWP